MMRISVAFCVLLTAAPCHADLVIHDNSRGQFDWELSVYLNDGSPRYGTFLDIRLAAEEQSGIETALTVSNWFSANHADDEPGLRGIVGDTKVRIARGEKVAYDWFGQTAYAYGMRDYGQGESVAASDYWDTTELYFLHWPGHSGLGEGAALIDTFCYFGVRIQEADGFHYGWVLFTDYATPVMWAYETQPGVAAPIPAPASIALAAMLGIRRRRRSRLAPAH